MIRINKNFRYTALIFLTILISKVNLAQNPFSKEFFVSNNKIYNAAEFNKPFGYVQKATRFIPLFSFDGFNEWSSPGLSFESVNSNYNIFPFNYSSPDLVPFDIWQNQLEKNKYIHESSAEKSSIKINTYKSSAAKMFFNSYFGSETGDPAIHVFTKQGSGIVNRNKIPVSGIFGISASSGDLFEYNISAGYFAAYSTGSINDNMLTTFDNYYYGKLNKQFMGSANIKLNIGESSSLLINAGIISYYGWDVAPFLGSFTHFEVINSTVRGNLITPIKGFSIAFRRDNGVGKINLTSVTKPSEFSIIKYALKPTYAFNEFGSNNHLFKTSLTSEVEFISAGNFDLDRTIQSKDFFTKDVREINLSIGGKAEYSGLWFSSKTELNFDNHFSGGNTISGLITLYDFKSSVLRNFSLTFSSITRHPNVTEIFGQYSFDRIINGKIETFTIQGDSKLKNERVNRFSLKYNPIQVLPGLQVELFLKFVMNPIKQLPGRIVRLSFERDVLRNAVYGNSSNKSGFGTIVNFETGEYSFIKFTGNYRFLQNDDAEYSPKHKFELSALCRLPFRAILTLNWQYNSKTVWKDFMVSPENDFYDGSGFEGRVGDVSSFNLYFDYSFSNFYLFENLNTRISFINIFNREMQYHPLGNRLDRAFVFSLAGNF